MFLKRHISFLKAVFIYTLTAFGGPQGHLGMMMKQFVTKRKFFSENELLEMNAFCQLLPGATSTQLITLLGYKRGGYITAVITFFIWILPASLIMALLSFVLTDYAELSGIMQLLHFIQPMAIGFLLFAFYRSYLTSIKNTTHHTIMLFAALFLFLFFRSPWIIPIIIILSGLVTYFVGEKHAKLGEIKKPSFKWGFLVSFLFLFLFVGILSEISRKKEWKNRTALNLIENNYRFGSLVFGGGDVLMPLMIDQYVARPQNERLLKRNPGIIVLSREDLLSGYGLVKAIPGPVFSISSFIAGVSLKKDETYYRLGVIFLATIAIFLPGVLLLFLFYPIWKGIRVHPAVMASLQGINAALVGIILSTILYLCLDLKNMGLNNNLNQAIVNLSVIITTFLLLNIKRFPATLIVLMCLLVSWFVGG